MASRRLPLLLVALALCAQAGCRTPGARPLGRAIDSNVQFSRRVPDVADYAAAELATAALNSDLGDATRLLRRLQSIDTVLESAGELPTGLVPVATDLVNATMDSPRVYRNATRALLERGDLDPALRKRLTQTANDSALSLADDRIKDARLISFARAFNSLAEPIGKSVMSTALAPYRLARSALNYALQLYQLEPLSLQRRQALAHWKDFVNRYPNAPEAAELRVRIERAEVLLNETLRDRACDAAEKALELGQERLALVYADRAMRYVPEDRWATELRDRAEKGVLENRANRARSLESPSQPVDSDAELRRLTIALLDPDADLAGELARFRETSSDTGLSDELEFLDAVLAGETGNEIQMWDELDHLAERSETNMARHANAIAGDPWRNSYESFERARNLDLKHRTLWVVLGPWSKGARDRGLFRPLEWLIDLPAIAQTVMAAPLRLLQVPFLDALPAEKLTAVFARQYLMRHPLGQHSVEVREWLSNYEESRDNWIGVYHLAEQDPEHDGRRLAELREKAADQALEFAGREPRRDLRNAMLRQVAQEYTDTDAGRSAGVVAGTEIENATPQRVAITRGFLVENREFAGPRGLGLAPQLLDDDASNGELHPSGLTLLGGNAVELRFVAPSGDEDEPPTLVYQQLSEPRFARLVASLEETAFHNSLLDSDDPILADASRDVFFERARVGLAREVDSRPLASSDFVYRGMRERYGMIRARESILPFDLVISGSLADLSLGAFPRIRAPKETPDAFLYR